MTVDRDKSFGDVLNNVDLLDDAWGSWGLISPFSDALTCRTQLLEINPTNEFIAFPHRQRLTWHVVVQKVVLGVSYVSVCHLIKPLSFLDDYYCFT